jgi:GntR family transcriptional regulator
MDILCRLSVLNMAHRLVDHMSPAGLALQLADILREQIRTRELSPGDLLPSEQALQQEHGIARGTVRKALTILSREGLVTALPGRGWVVRKH